MDWGNAPKNKHEQAALDRRQLQHAGRRSNYLDTLYNLMDLVFVLGTIISISLSLTMKQITGPLRNIRVVIVALLANFVIPSIVAFANAYPGTIVLRHDDGGYRDETVTALNTVLSTLRGQGYRFEALCR